MPSQPPITTVTRTRPKVLRALGAEDPPSRIQIEGTCYQRVEVFKHDSWAATAMYESISPAGHTSRLVCKFNRTQSIYGIPMTWLGRALATREAQAYQRLADLPGVPGVAGEIHAENRRLSATELAGIHRPGNRMG